MTTHAHRLRVTIALVATGWATPLVAQPSGSQFVRFPGTGSPEARRHVEMGIAALHNFWYDEATKEFREAQRIDPEFVMAYWGEAMVSYYPWNLGDSRVEAIRAVLERLAPTAEERRAKTHSTRERAYMAALENLVADGTNASRRLAFAAAMREVAASYPEDLEAQAFFALSLFGAADNLRSHPRVREEAVAAVDRVLARLPEHPGALHYKIHALDSPETAHRALDVAQTYDRQSPDAPHALHMPAHIYLQHAMWDDVVRTNETAFRVSDEWMKAQDRSLEQRDYHALGWLPYARLQKGQYGKAWETVALMDELVEETGSRNLGWYHAEWHARHVVETRRWQTDPLPTSGFNNRTEFVGTALNAAHVEDLPTARQMLAKSTAAAERSRERSGERAEGTLRWVIAAREIESIIALSEGRRDRAVESLREALASQEYLPPPNELPDPIKPPNELLGEVLLELTRPEEAAEQFRIALNRRAGRAASLLGLARADAAMGDRAAARESYQRLLDQWHEADEDIPGLKEARAYVEKRE